MWAQNTELEFINWWNAILVYHTKNAGDCFIKYQAESEPIRGGAF